MMENLSVTLHKLLQLLGELEGSLTEEIKQLSQAQINPVSLQIISDNKSRLLSGISFYDEQRKQIEKQQKVASPYPQQRELARLWRDITANVGKSSDLNQKSFLLLDMHMKKVNDFKKIVQQSTASTSLYGERGNPSQDGTRNTCRVSV